MRTLILLLLASTLFACEKGETRADQAPTDAATAMPDKADDAKKMADKKVVDKAAADKAVPTDKKMAAKDAFTHGDFDTLLKKFVTVEGGVKYKEWKGDVKAKEALDAYVARVETFPASTLKGQEQLAFYINAYNAITLKAVLDRYPIKSVMDVKGFFDGIKHKVAGEEFTLNELEGQKIRKAFQEPRIHFVVNCASASCPILQRDALTKDNLVELMEKGTKAYIAQETKVDIKKKVVDTSKIFEWYKDDFEGKGGVKGFIAAYLPKEQAAVLPDAKITTHEYGWTLNEAK